MKDLVIRIIVLALMATLIGCGGDSRVASVRGSVTMDGDPVADASIAFIPQAGGRPAFGITDADGEFELTTFKDGDGALIGKHTVTILAVDEKVNSKAKELAEEHGSLSELMQPAARPKETWLVPEEYADKQTSGLEFEVVSGEENRADFALPN